MSPEKTTDLLRDIHCKNCREMWVISFFFSVFFLSPVGTRPGGGWCQRSPPPFWQLCWRAQLRDRGLSGNGIFFFSLERSIWLPLWPCQQRSAFLFVCFTWIWQQLCSVTPRKIVFCLFGNLHPTMVFKIWLLNGNSVSGRLWKHQETASVRLWRQNYGFIW